MNTRAPVGRGAAVSNRTQSTASNLIMDTIWVGLALTAVAAIVPYIDRATSDTLADHIHAGYPAYSQERIDIAATTYLVYLTVVGVLGVLSWLWVARAVRTGKRWARATATAMFLVGTGIALIDLLINDTSGETGLPPLIGWTGVLPCLPGLLVVTLLWTGEQQ